MVHRSRFSGSKTSLAKAAISRFGKQFRVVDQLVLVRENTCARVLTLLRHKCVLFKRLIRTCAHVLPMVYSYSKHRRHQIWLSASGVRLSIVLNMDMLACAAQRLAESSAGFSRRVEHSSGLSECDPTCRVLWCARMARSSVLSC